MFIRIKSLGKDNIERVVSFATQAHCFGRLMIKMFTLPASYKVLPSFLVFSKSLLKPSIFPYRWSISLKSITPGLEQSVLLADSGDRMTASAPMART